MNFTKSLSSFLTALSLMIGLTGIIMFVFACQETATDPQAVYKKLYQPDTKNIDVVIDDLSAFGMADSTKGKQDTLAQALKLYKSGDYEDARKQLVEYLDRYPEDKSAKFYLGLSLMQQSEFAKASQHLQALTAADDFTYINDAKWYLALCYSQFGTESGLSNARKLMTQLKENFDSGFSEEAEMYLALMD